MIEITMHGEDYEQDIRPLIKAFYPEEDIQVYKDTSEFDNNNGCVTKSDVLNKDVCKEESDDGRIEISFALNKAAFSITLKKEDVLLKEENDELVDTDNRSVYRNSLHRALYRLLARETKKELPWGTLTGIRPTKQVLDRLEVNEPEEKIRSFMKKEYYCSDEKIDVSMQVAKREQEILKGIDYKNSYSIYIGIPFCPSTCNYCSFTSFPLLRHEHMVDPYLRALTKEIEYAKTCFPEKSLATLYVGGGTPTTLNEKQLAYLMETIHKNFDVASLKELTVEAGRPDSITKEKLKILKDFGVGRISINPQSMRQKTLDIIGRKHSVEQIEEAFYMAREVGHDNINMDIIVGLSGETPEDVSYTLDRIHKLNPDSLTVHTLAIKRAARLNTNKEQYANLKAQDPLTMLKLTYDYAKENDYLPYYLYRQKNMAENLENIGYARYGKEGIYNILIMEEKQTILALGAGGSSKFVFHNENRIERVENVKSLKDYNERVDEMISRKTMFLNSNGDALWI